MWTFLLNSVFTVILYSFIVEQLIFISLWVILFSGWTVDLIAPCQKASYLLLCLSVNEWSCCKLSCVWASVFSVFGGAGEVTLTCLMDLYSYMNRQDQILPEVSTSVVTHFQERCLGQFQLAGITLNLGWTFNSGGAEEGKPWAQLSRCCSMRHGFGVSPGHGRLLVLALICWAVGPVSFLLRLRAGGVCFGFCDSLVLEEEWTQFRCIHAGSVPECSSKWIYDIFTF